MLLKQNRPRKLFLGRFGRFVGQYQRQNVTYVFRMIDILTKWCQLQYQPTPAFQRNQTRSNLKTISDI